jgi:hypothetical protein
LGRSWWLVWVEYGVRIGSVVVGKAVELELAGLSSLVLRRGRPVYGSYLRLLERECEEEVVVVEVGV